MWLVIYTNNWVTGLNPRAITISELKKNPYDMEESWSINHYGWLVNFDTVIYPGNDGAEFVYLFENIDNQSVRLYQKWMHSGSSGTLVIRPVITIDKSLLK